MAADNLPIIFLCNVIYCVTCQCCDFYELPAATPPSPSPQPDRWIWPSVGSSVALTDLLRSLTSQLICNGAQWTSTPIQMELGPRVDLGVTRSPAIHVGGPIHWVRRSNRRMWFSFERTKGRGEFYGFLRGVNNFSCLLIKTRSLSHRSRFRPRLRHKWYGVGAWDSAETQAASLPHHLHRRTTGGPGASLRPHPISGRLHAGGAGPDHGPDRGSHPGVVLQPKSPSPQALRRLELRTLAHEQWQLKCGSGRWTQWGDSASGLRATGRGLYGRLQSCAGSHRKWSRHERGSSPRRPCSQFTSQCCSGCCGGASSHPDGWLRLGPECGAARISRKLCSAGTL